jgi:ABC-2 type transport system ATP-binding protein
MGEEVLLQIENLSKSFGRKHVLKDLNLKVKKGEILGIIGGSGQGKSVLMKTIIKFLKPSKGKITLNTKSKNISFSMQHNAIYESLTVKQNWKFFAKLYGIKRKERKEKIKQLLTDLELDEYKNTLVRKLSGGTKKRVDIGCGLLINPELIILDEPFTGLDQGLVKHLARYILHLKEKGTTVILISHRLKLLTRIASRVLILKDKKMTEIKKDKIWEVYEDIE